MKNLIRKSILKITPYEPGKPIEEVQRELGLKEVIKLASNENPLGVSPKAIAAIKKSLNKINRYPEGSCFYLRKRLAQKLKVSPPNLIFGNGSDELIDIIVKTFLDKDDGVITSKTTFLEYEIIVKANGFKTNTVSLRDFKYDLSAIKKAINKKTKLIFIANPNNPTGTYVTKQELDNFLEGLPKRIIVVLDEAYNEFVDVKDFPNGLDYLKNNNLLVLRTFSKTFGLAGLRVGAGVAKPDFIKYMERARQPFNVNSLAQIGALAAIDDTDFLRRAQNTIWQGKRYLYTSLNKLGLDYIPSVANFILIDLRQSGLEIFKKMLRQGVIVRDMEQYGLKNFIRVTIGTQKENEKFIEALTRVL